MCKVLLFVFILLAPLKGIFFIFTDFISLLFAEGFLRSLNNFLVVFFRPKNILVILFCLSLFGFFFFVAEERGGGKGVVKQESQGLAGVVMENCWQFVPS